MNSTPAANGHNEQPGAPEGAETPVPTPPGAGSVPPGYPAPPPWSTTPAPQNSRTPAIIAAVVGAVLVLGGLGGIAFFASRHTSDHPSSSAPVATGTGTAQATTAASAAPRASTSGGGAATGACDWRAAAAGNPATKDVGKPPTAPATGTHVMTITTNVGVIQIQLDTAHAPCTVTSFAYLAGKHFFDKTSCHRLTTNGIYVLQCGDPTGSGAGGPSYEFNDENLAATSGTYPRGMVAMANAGAGTNGSQFFLTYKDSPLQPNYTPFGTVTQGLDVLDKIAAAGADDANGPGDGHPKQAVTITSLTVS